MINDKTNNPLKQALKKQTTTGAKLVLRGVSGLSELSKCTEVK
ncbi:hypothetical protein [Photobacterium damselae]